MQNVLNLRDQIRSHFLSVLILAMMGLFSTPIAAQLSSANLVSEAVTGESANGESLLGAISDLGDVVAFSSTATNMIAGEQADPSVSRIYLHGGNLALPLRQISRGIGAPANGSSRSPSLSSFGQHIAFSSRASNLISTDYNAFEDIYAVFAGTTATSPPDPALTVRLSTNEFGTTSNGDSKLPVISGDGRHVLFLSRASNLDLGSGIIRSDFDLFVVDRDSNQTGTLDEAGTLRPVRLIQSTTGAVSSPAFYGYDISQDGRYVVFATAFRGVTADPVTAIYNLYFHDRDTDNDGIFDEPGAIQTTLLGRAPDGTALSADAVNPYISDSAGRVLFHSVAAEIQSGCTSGSDCAIFVADIPTSGSGLTPDPASATIVLALSGREAHLSAAGDSLVYTNNAQRPELTAYEIPTGNSRPVCVSETLRRGNRGCAAGLAGNGAQLAALESASSNLVPLDSNGFSDVFIHNGNGFVSPSPPSPACDDQIDNDGNNLIDMQDPGCYAPEDNNEAPGERVLSVPVTSAADRVGAFTVVDQHYRAGQEPSFAIGPSVRHTAYTVNGSVSTGGIEYFRHSRLLQPAADTELKGEGKRPVIAVGSLGGLHTAYIPDGRQVLGYLDDASTPLQVLEFTGNCNGGNNYYFTLILDNNDSPRIPNWDVCSNEVKIWRPGQPAVAVATAALGRVELIDAASDPLSDGTILAYVDRENLNEQPAKLNLLRLGNADVVLSQMTIDTVRNPFALDVRTDVNGAGHVTYFGPVSTYSSTGRVHTSALVYFREQTGTWQRHEFRLREFEHDFWVQMHFADDGITPYFILTKRNEPEIRQFTFTGGELLEVTAPRAVGHVSTFSLDQDSNGSYEFAYHDLHSDNIVHADPGAPPWSLDVVSEAPSTDLQDLVLSEPSRYQRTPALLTFTAPTPYSAGEMLFHNRDLQTGQWVSETLGPASLGDSVDLSDNAEAVAQYVGLEKTLRYYYRSPQGAWDMETVTTLTGFDSLDSITLDKAGELAEIYAIFRGGDGASGDRLIVYRRTINGQWQATPFDNNPITFIAQADTSRAHVAYIDGSNDLNLARYDRQTNLWSSELVDTDTNAPGVGKVLSIKTVPTLMPEGFARLVPTIAYRTGAQNRIRYAMKFNDWRIWDYSDTTSAGVTVDAVHHELVNDSRLRPVIAARHSDGTVVTYRRAGGSAADDADAVVAEREIISENGHAGNGLGLIRVSLSATPIVAFSNAGQATMLASASNASGLPAANPAINPNKKSAESTAFGDLAADMCLCFMDLVFGNIDSTYCEGLAAPAARQIKSPDKANINTLLVNSDGDLPANDEVYLGQWGTLFNRNAAGRRYIDFFARDYPKIARLVAQDLSLLNDGVNTLQNFMPGIRAMVSGNGDQVFLTQKMIDDALDVWQRLSDRDSGTLSAFIEIELAQWSDMQDFVGLTFDEWGTMIGLQVGPVGNDVLFSDSFED